MCQFNFGLSRSLLGNLIRIMNTEFQTVYEEQVFESDSIHILKLCGVDAVSIGFKLVFFLNRTVIY